MITSLYWERFYIRPARYWEYHDINHRYIHRYTGITVYLNCIRVSRVSSTNYDCINRGALELTKTIMCKPQVQNSDYHPWPLPSTLTLDSRPLPLTCDPRFSNAALESTRVWSAHPEKGKLRSCAINNTWKPYLMCHLACPAPRTEMLQWVLTKWYVWWWSCQPLFQKATEAIMTQLQRTFLFI